MKMKKTRKRLFSILLVAVMLFGILPAASYADGDESLLVYFVCDDAVASVTVFDASGELIPVAADGYHHLSPGSYFYSAEAEGFETQTMRPFYVPVDAVGDQQLQFSMTPVADGEDEPEVPEGSQNHQEPQNTQNFDTPEDDPPTPVTGGIFDAHYGRDQVFDVQRDPDYPAGTQEEPAAFTVKELAAPAQLEELGEEDYFYFVGLGPASLTGVAYSDSWNAAEENLDPYTVSLHVVRDGEDTELARGVIGAFSAEGFLFAAGGEGIWFSNICGYHYSSTEITYAPLAGGRLVCDVALLQNCVVESMLQAGPDSSDHVHKWVAETEGNRVVFRCEEADCPLGEDSEYSMSLLIPAFIHSGEKAEAVVEKSVSDEEWPAELEQNIICYEGRGETEYAGGMTPPADLGTYTAKVSVGYRQDPQILEANFMIVSEVPVPFEQTLSANGVVVTVRAEPGVFPADALLTVTGIDIDEAMEAAITAIRSEEESPLAASAVGIQITDADGKQLQPLDGHGLSVSLSLAEPADEGLVTSVYRIVQDGEDSVSAEVLPVNETGGSTAEVEAGGSMCFVLELSEPPADLSGYPAVTFSDRIGDLGVEVEAPAGAFPEGTVMRLAMVEQEEIMDALNSALDEGTTIRQVKAVDISFLYEDEVIEPEREIHVSIRDQMVEEASGAQLVHVDAEGKAALVTQADEETDADELSFSSDSFSTYAIIISTRVITAEGETYVAELSYSDNARLPAGAYLTASELLPEDEGYQGYYDAVLEAGGNAEPDGLRLFDITVHAPDGAAVEPAAPVQISIRLDAPLSEAENYSVSVIHFVDGGEPEFITPESGNQTAADAGEEEPGAAEPASEAKTGGEFLRFETGSLSVYAVSAYQVTSDLDGKTFVIGRQSVSLTASLTASLYVGRSLQAVAADGYTTGRLNSALYGYFPNRPNSEGEGKKLLQAYSADLTEWTFTKVEGTKYTLQADNGKYLKIGSDGSLTAGDNPQPLRVTVVNEKYVRISSDDGWYVKNSSGDSNVSPTTGINFLGSQQTGAQCDLTLYETTMYDPVVTATKRSVSDMVEGLNGRYLIYQSAYNPQSGKYEDFAIDGYGNLVKVYDNGDKIEYRGPEDEGSTVRDELLWQFTICKDTEGQPNGYYVLQNYATKNVLDPAENHLVGQFVSLNTSGIRLRGREDNGYNSTMEKWNSSDNLYWGYQIVEDENNSLVLRPASGPASQEFSFAELVHETAELHTVATVDSAAHGIEMHLFDYGSARSDIQWATGTVNYTSGAAGLTPNLTNRKLGSNGLPVFRANPSSGSTRLFGLDGGRHVGEVNHLFIESIYKSTGYYEYSSFDNFAQAGSKTGGNFKVYSELGHYSPNTAAVSVNTRGQFLPLNELNPNSVHTATAAVSGEGTLLPFENPTSENTLYGLGKDIMTGQNATNYHFGLSIGYDFMMPKDGIVGNGPLIYDFYGDDDLWVFVDGVLLLDLGGIHDAFSGHIDFSTGKITGVGVNETNNTIKKCFQLADVFPDGSRWDDSQVDKHFKGDTFVDYGGHSFKMFYMESGEGASNLKVRFNMPVIEPGQVTVEKKLANTIQEPYANVPFAYQAFIKYNTEDFVPLVPGMTFEGLAADPVSLVYEGTETEVPFYETTTIGGKEYTNVFYLKPQEAATFRNLPENALYYVQEVGVSADYYDKIIINDSEIYGDAPEAQHALNENGVYKTSEDTVRRRPRVTYQNTCSEKNLNSLLIHKAIQSGCVDDGKTFEFRVLMENTAGELVPYNTGTYYVKKDGHYYRYLDGQFVDNGSEPVAYRSGPYGTIAGIPIGFTVEIPQLLVDTAFYVDEIRLPEGWDLTSKVLKPGSYDPDDLSGTAWDYTAGASATFTADGKIKLDTDAEVTFTNHTLVDLSVTKVWDDSDNKRGMRPSSVTFYLLSDGKVLEDKTVELKPDEEGVWPTHTWEDLPRNNGSGTEIVYTVQEKVIQDYTATVSGNVTDGFKVTNKLNPPVSPHTGDDTNILPWLGALLLSGCTLMTDILLRSWKKNRRERRRS